MSLILCNDWFVNSDKTVTFYDTTLHQEFKTGQKKDGKYEHVVNFTKHAPYVSTQVIGYQISMVKKHSYVMVLTLGRRLRLVNETEGEKKKEKKDTFVQTQDDIEILFGLKEGKLSTEVEQETQPEQEQVTQTQQEQVTQTA
jgi:hypothetical protein